MQKNYYDEDFKKSIVSLYHNGKSHLKKSDCHIHATRGQRLDAVHKLRFQHSIKLLCKVLGVNRSSYYKHFSTKTAPRVKENQEIATNILKIVADYDKRVGAYKITHILERDYGIKISPGRVYRLIKTLNLPRMSTQKPVIKYSCRRSHRIS